MLVSSTAGSTAWSDCFGTMQLSKNAACMTLSAYCSYYRQ